VLVFTGASQDLGVFGAVGFLAAVAFFGVFAFGINQE
jgi:hypothetical protein